MNLHSEKGYTVVDIAISIIIITIFIALIAVIISRFNSSAKELKYKEEAMAIAIEEIEKIKENGFEAYKDMDKDSTQDEEGNSFVNQPTGEEGFYKTILIEDYTDLEGNEEKIPGLVKKVTVKISYMFQGKEQAIELSTILSKEN